MYLKDLDDLVFLIIAGNIRMSFNGIWKYFYENDKRITRKKMLAVLDKLFRQKKISRIITVTEIYPDARKQKIEYQVFKNQP